MRMIFFSSFLHNSNTLYYLYLLTTYVRIIGPFCHPFKYWDIYVYDFCGARIMTSEASHEEIDDKLIPATSNSPPNVNPTTAVSAENTAQLKDKGNHQEIDDETPKTFPQTVSRVLVRWTFSFIINIRNFPLL